MGRGSDVERFERWCGVVGELPRKQTRVLTWPVVTVFGFEYTSRPGWPTYNSLLQFARQVCADQRDLRPRDQIDAQSFIWVQGSDEY